MISPPLKNRFSTSSFSNFQKKFSIRTQLANYPNISFHLVYSFWGQFGWIKKDFLRVIKSLKKARFWFTLHLNEKNLSTNSSWGFEHIFDTMDYYWSCPDESFFHRTLPTRWRCDHFSQKCPKSKLDTTFWYKKTSVTPTFCKRNSFRTHRFGAMNFLSSKIQKAKIDYY